MKRFVSILLCMSMLLLVFSGCAARKNDSEENDSSREDTRTNEIVSVTTTATTEDDPKLSASEIYEKNLPSVVELIIKVGEGDALGSGFFLDDKGTVVTNYHVIDGGQKGTVICSDGEEYKIKKVLGYDPELDIAVLSTSAKNTQPLELEKGEVKNGADVYVIGAPNGFAWSISDGIVANVKQTATHPNGITSDYIQHTAPTSPGNSGGPVMDDHGRVIGIVVMYYLDGQNLNFAIPINKLDQVELTANMTLEEVYEEEYGSVSSHSDWDYGYILDDGEVKIFIKAPKDLDCSYQTENGVEYAFLSYSEDDRIFMLQPGAIAFESGSAVDTSEIAQEIIAYVDTYLDELGIDSDQVIMEQNVVRINGINWSALKVEVSGAQIEGDSYGGVMFILFRPEGNTIYYVFTMGIWEENWREAKSRAMMKDWMSGMLGSIEMK